MCAKPNEIKRLALAIASVPRRYHAAAPRLELFPFRYRDPRTGKWTTARYRAERREIAARYA